MTAKVPPAIGSHEAMRGRSNDESLTARVARGDRTALELLYDRYAALILGLSVRIIGDRAAAEEVLEETFWKLWNGPSNLSSGRGSFADWVFRTARHLALDARRRRAPDADAGKETPGDALGQEPLPASESVAQAQLSSVPGEGQARSEMRALAPLERQVLEMAYFSGMTRQEISEITGAALADVHSLARRGLEKLRGEPGSETSKQ